MQAMLILAHKDVQQVVALAKVLTKNFLVYVHFDMKHLLSEEDKEMLNAIENLRYVQKYDVNWGAWSICEAQILLMRLALENDKLTYVHLISGSDWPTMPLNEIYEFYENNFSIYMMAQRAKEIRKTGEPVLLWQKYYWEYDRIPRKTFYGKVYHRLSLLWQTMTGTDKFKDLDIDLEIWHGSNWCDLPRDAVEYLLEYFDRNQNVQRLFKTGFCSDEFWVQTILCNSDRYKERIIHNNHRYILMKKKHGSRPAILDENDYDDIISGDYHFARKMDKAISQRLIEKLMILQ